MTKLIVTPIDLSAAGSYRKRKAFIRVLRKIRQADNSKDADAALDAFEEADALIVSHLRTDDDTPVETALEKLSAKQFDQLLSEIAFQDSEEVVPPASAGSSGDSPAASQ